jgi:hypothetical protein
MKKLGIVVATLVALTLPAQGGAMSFAATALAAATLPLVIPGHPSVRPWPIGHGAAYRPPAAARVVRAGRPAGTLRCARGGASFELHLELFAAQRVIVVPAGIGIATPMTRRGAAVVADGCTYPLWTLAPGGVIEVRGRRLDLADLFVVWGQALGSRRLASFMSAAPLRAYVGGRRVHGPVGEIALASHEEIVLELGGYVAPHASFLFAGGGT